MKTYKHFLSQIDLADDTMEQFVNNHIVYYEFKLPKSQNKMRLIEAPAKRLKQVQKILSQYLYQHYAKEVPASVHGFIKTAPTTRNILSNAKAHLGKKYLVNVDLKDFYHQIIESYTSPIFVQYFRDLKTDDLNNLNKLVLHKCRLPMGAPTSSVISNKAFLGADLELERYCHLHNITYTRYVDDLSFSSGQAISTHTLEELLQIISNHGFKENPEKIKFYGPREVKLITGIAMEGLHWEVAPKMKSRLEKNMVVYERLRSLATQLKFLGVSPKNVAVKSKMKTLRKAIKGQLQFIKQIEGEKSDFYKSSKKKWKNTEMKGIDLDMSVYI